MQIVSAREYRSNQGKFMKAAKNGQTVVLTSRYGKFKLTPIEEEEEDSSTLTERICRGLEQVKLIMDGKLPRRTIDDLLNEL